MKNILIIGATSAIATATARVWAEKQANFFLVARNAAKLKQVSDDLKARGANAIYQYVLDMNQINEHENMFVDCFKKLKQVDIALIAHGTYPDQTACEKNIDLALREFSNNGLSVIAALLLLANHMETQQHGTIAVISSVAGDRGRQSNYLYGTAKAAVSTFCEGLRGRLCKAGVNVVLIKPGFVKTPMTKELIMPGLLLAEPKKVAKDIVKAIQRKAHAIYTPYFWALIMFIIRSIPTTIFKRLKI